MLAVPRHRAAATGRKGDGIAFTNVDKDTVGAQPRSLDRGDQPLAALVGAQVTHRAAPLIRTAFVNLAVETAADVAFIKREPPDWSRSDAKR
jgi:hypothetical protein